MGDDQQEDESYKYGRQAYEAGISEARLTEMLESFGVTRAATHALSGYREARQRDNQRQQQRGSLA